MQHQQQVTSSNSTGSSSAEPTAVNQNGSHPFSSPTSLSRNNSGLDQFHTGNRAPSIGSVGSGGPSKEIPQLRDGLPGSFQHLHLAAAGGVTFQPQQHFFQLPQHHHQQHHSLHYHHGGSSHNLAAGTASSPVNNHHHHNNNYGLASTVNNNNATVLQRQPSANFSFAKQDQNACSHCFGAETITTLAQEANTYIEDTLPQVSSLENDSFFPVPCPPPPALSPMSGTSAVGGVGHEGSGRQQRTGSDLRQSFRNSNRLSSSGNQFAMQSSTNSSSGYAALGEAPGSTLSAAGGSANAENTNSGVQQQPHPQQSHQAAPPSAAQHQQQQQQLTFSRTSRDEVLSPRSFTGSSGLEPKILSLQEIQLHSGFSPKLSSAEPSTTTTPPLLSTTVAQAQAAMANSTGAAVTPHRASTTAALLHRQWSSASQLQTPSSPSNQRHSFTGADHHNSSLNSSNTNNHSNAAIQVHSGTGSAAPEGAGSNVGTPHRHSDGGGGFPPPMSLPSPTTKVIHLPSPLITGALMRSLGQIPTSPTTNHNATTPGHHHLGSSSTNLHSSLSFAKGQRKDSDILKGQLTSLSHGQLLAYAERLTTWMQSIHTVANNRLVDPCTCGTVAVAESTPDLGAERTAEDSPSGGGSGGGGGAAFLSEADASRVGGGGGGLSRFASFFNVTSTTSDPSTTYYSAALHHQQHSHTQQPPGIHMLPPSQAPVVSTPTPHDGTNLGAFQAFVVAGGGGQYFGQHQQQHAYPIHTGAAGEHSFASASIGGAQVSISSTTIGGSAGGLAAPHNFALRKSSIDTVASAGTGVSSATNSPTMHAVPGLPLGPSGTAPPSNLTHQQLPQLPPSLPNSSRGGGNDKRRGTVTILPQRAGGRQKSVVVFASTNSSAHASPRPFGQGLEHPPPGGRKTGNMFNSSGSPIPDQASPRHAPLLTFEPIDPSVGMDEDPASVMHEPLRARKSLIMSTHVAIEEDDVSGFEMVNQYLMMEEIGAGVSGIVFAVCNTDSNSDFAMKMIKRDRFSQRRGSNAGGGGGGGGGTTNREVAIMKKLRHPHVVRLHEVIDDPTHNKLYLVMQLLTGGRLCPSLDATTGACEPVSSELLKRYVYQMCDGLRYLHQHNIIHRDVKPENMMLDEGGNVVLVDFGVSEVTSDDQNVEGAVGTPAFMAPEVWAGDRVSGAAADVWSLGVSVFMMLVGRSPFPATNRTDLIEQVKNRNPDFPHDIETEWRKLLKGMLTKDPATRSSLSAVMRNPMFAQFRSQDVNGNSVRPSALRGAIVVTEDDLQAAIADRADFQVLVCDDDGSPAESISTRVDGDTPKAAVTIVQPLRGADNTAAVPGSSSEGNLSQRSSPGALASTQFYGTNPVVPVPMISTSTPTGAAISGIPMMTSGTGLPMMTTSGTGGASGNTSARAAMHGIISYGVQHPLAPTPGFSGNVSAATGSISPNHLHHHGGVGGGENSIATSFGFGEHSLSAGPPFGGGGPPALPFIPTPNTMVVCVPEEKLQRAKSRRFVTTR